MDGSARGRKQFEARVTDHPKALADEEARHQRAAMLRLPHIAPLSDLVDEMRRERGVTREIPYFDPLDGGVRASVLFILEAPGPKAVMSGFVSRDNPDESAKNFWLACREAKLPREVTVIWNVVPWYLGDGRRIRPATASDIALGKRHLELLISLLARLEMIVLVGRKAQQVDPWLQELLGKRINILGMPHPSPVFVNRRPENRGLLVEAIRRVAQYVGSSS